MTTPHIGPLGYRPGDMGYEFDCGLDDCRLRYHSPDYRDPMRGVLEIVPPEGKVAHLQIGAQIKAAPAALAALAKAEGFVAGFEDDETQKGVSVLLAEIRTALAISL
jgi:hypothetical protein